MSRVKSDFKVFVSDEILDFRTLKEKHGRASPTNLLPRTQSQDAIDVHKYKDMPIVSSNETPENVSKQLYNSASTLADKYRYPRLKFRSRTVDPRFRKSRPPTDKLLTGSQSTTDIIKPSMPLNQARKKPFSPSHLPTTTNRDLRKPPKFTRNSKETEVETILPYKCAADKRQENYKHADDQHEAGDEQKIYTEHAATITEPQKFSINSIGDGRNILPTGLLGITENDVIEEPESSNNIGDSQLVDGCTDKISPYWDDPCLLEKHYVMKPVHSEQSKSSLGVSATEHTPAAALICRNCLTSQWISPEYKYDDRTEIFSTININETNNTEKDDYSTLVVYMAVGSITGILITSFFAWFISENVSWDFSKLWTGKPPPPPETSIMDHVMNAGKNVLYWVNTLYSKAYEILKIPLTYIPNNHARGTYESNRWW